MTTFSESHVNGPLTDFSAFASRHEVISTDGYKLICEQTENTSYLKRDFLYKGGVFRGAPVPSLISRPTQFRDRTLVVGHSDIATRTSDIRFLKFLGIRHVFGTNTNGDDKYAGGLPLGLTNYTNESSLHNVFGNVTHLKRATEICRQPLDFSPNIFVNFTRQNNSRERNHIFRLIEENHSPIKFIIKSPIFSDQGRLEFLKDCRSSNFVLCPEGNGVDTHRLWETLYVGGIPIVKKSKFLPSSLQFLPVIQINKWKEIFSLDFLEKEWERVQKLHWNSEILSLNYWKQVITEI